MSTKNKAAVAGMGAGVGTAILVAGMGAGIALASTATADAAAATVATPTTQAQAATTVATQAVQLETVQGTFGYTQSEVASNDYLAKHFAEGSKYLCGANATTEQVDAEDWTITVDGAVSNGYSATVEEIASSDAVQSVLMGCSCAGNPVDGQSTANAMVNGISALIMINMASPSADANTVVFTSSDGYQIALPLSYLETHYAPIVFDVNGSSIAESMGGVNQLWLGSTPASYFIRNVSKITLETRDEADIPANPTSDEARAQYSTNLPNVGVLFGGEVA